MKRRRLVSGVGAAVFAAGCLGALDGGPEYGDPNPIEEDPRTDYPPHEIEVDHSAGESEWDEEALCANMAERPSLEFEPLPDVELTDASMRHADSAGGHYHARLLTEREAADSVLRDVDVDFDTHVLVVVEQGNTSGSISHGWRRVEADGNRLHLHGCIVRPYYVTADSTTHSSVLKIERPEIAEIEFARVSLTTTPIRRVHFNSTEGIVTV